MGSQERGKSRLTGRTWLALAVSLMVAFAVGYGLYSAGSPGQARQFQSDQRRLEDLRMISGGVQSHYGLNGRLPADLSELDGRSQTSLQDPITGQSYEYRKIDDDSYELCATFAFSSEEASDYSDRYRYYSQPLPVKGEASYIDGFHQAGRHCFTLKAFDDKEGPVPIR